MARRIVEAGRLDFKGAAVRFKQRATLEPFDRNLAQLSKVRVRVSPSPELKLFADFEFPEEVFRIHQDSTLVNYKDFLEKIEFSGLENFRAMVRFASRTLEAPDPATLDFADKKASPERFVSKEEMAEYDAAITAGTVPLDVRKIRPAAALSAGSAPASASAPALEKQVLVEQAWKQFEPEIEKARAEEKTDPRSGGLVLASMGAGTVLLSLGAFARSRRLAELTENAPNVYPLVAFGMIVGLAFLVAGVLYIRRAPPGEKTAKPSARRGLD